MSDEKKLIVSFDDFVDSLELEPKVDYDVYRESLSVLYTNYSRMHMDSVHAPVVRHTVSNFILKYGRTDFRFHVKEQYIQSCYEMFVQDREATLLDWYERYISFENARTGLNFNVIPCGGNEYFDGTTNSESSRFLRNINYQQMYSTKRLHQNDFQDCISILKCLFKFHYLRNSFVGPASFNFFLDKNLTAVWSSVMSTISKPSIFNPNTYASILTNVFEGTRLFAPTMGWNSYQLAYYQTNYEEFVACDVIEEVVDNGEIMHNLYESNKNPFLDYGCKSVTLYDCPSEYLDDRYDFIEEYENHFDAVLFGPPCFKLEMYSGEEQSANLYQSYTEWLSKYWEQTIKLCHAVMRPGAKLGFVIKDYSDYYGMAYSLEADMGSIAKRFFAEQNIYKIKLSQMKTRRSPKKLVSGNYEKLLVYEKES